MGEWIYRQSIQEDWITIIYFFNLLIISSMSFVNGARINALVKINKSGIYNSKFTNDKDLNYLSPFNILSFSIIINSLGQLYLWFLKINQAPINYALEYYYFLFSLSIIFIIRFLLVQFVSENLYLMKTLKGYYFKNFTYNTQFALFSSTLLFFANYSQVNSLIINIFLGIAFIAWISAQLTIIFSFINSNSKDLFYLIVYICSIKIAPWFWLYFIFIEPIL